MPQYALRTIRFPVNNPCHNFPSFGPRLGPGARQEAARELLAEAIKDGRAEVPEAFAIADEEEREIDAVPLAAVLPENLKR